MPSHGEENIKQQFVDAGKPSDLGLLAMLAYIFLLFCVLVLCREACRFYLGDGARARLELEL